MPKLETIFQIEDNQAREKALVAYAKSLRVNVLKAKKADGSYSENELAVLIFNVEQSRKNNKFQNIAMLAVALFIMIVVVAGIVLLKIMVSG
jgi:ABC-type phosphate transport system permease subunit